MDALWLPLLSRCRGAPQETSPLAPGKGAAISPGSTVCLASLHTHLVPETQAVGAEEPQQPGHRTKPQGLHAAGSRPRPQVRLLSHLCVSVTEKTGASELSIFTRNTAPKTPEASCASMATYLMLTTAMGTIPSDDSIALSLLISRTRY